MTRPRMSPALGALLGLVASALTAQIPAHPSLLRFTDVDFVLPDPAKHRIELAGGSVLYLVEDHALPLVDIAVAVRAGGFLDPPRQAGLALLTGSLMRRGGSHERSADELDEAIDYLGARIGSQIG